MFGTLANLSLGNTVIKHVAEFRRIDPPKAGKMIGFGLISIGFTACLAATILFVFAPQIADHGLGTAHLESLLRVLSLDIAFTAIDSVQIGALIGMESFQLVATIVGAKNIFGLAITVPAATIDGLRGVVVAQLLTDAVFVAINAIILRRRCRHNAITISYDVSLSDWHTMRDFSLPTFLTSALGWFAQWFSNAALGRQANGYAQFATFQVGRQWGTVVTMVPNAIGDAGLPMISNHYGEGRVDDFSATVNRQYSLAFRVSTLAATAVAVLSPVIISAYGKDFKGSYLPIVIMSGCGVCQSLATISNGLIFSTGRLWRGFVFTLGYSTVLIALAFYLRSYGAVGLATAYCLAYIADVIMLKSFANRTLNDLTTAKEQTTDQVKVV